MNSKQEKIKRIMDCIKSETRIIDECGRKETVKIKKDDEMTDWKTKYPIGSQWKCRDGSRAVVVEHSYRGLKYWRSGSINYDVMYVCNPDAGNPFIEPWSEPRVFEYDLCIIEKNDGSHALEIDDGLLTKIIARKRIIITEGEGL